MWRCSFDVPPEGRHLRLVAPVEEIDVASLVVHARPERVEELEEAIAAFAGVEVAAADRSGKLVVTIEADNERSITHQLDAIGALPGVLSVTIVAHHAEALAPEAEGGSP
jgi:periplasmic nitrate reductase NapD